MEKRGADEKYSMAEAFKGLEKRYSLGEEHGVELILAGFVGIVLALFLKTIISYRTGMAVSEIASFREPNFLAFLIVFSILIIFIGFFKKRKNKILKNQLALRQKLILGR
jgi:uncharacterized membrane protein